MKIQHSTCNCCGKPLSDPISMETGYGPVCRVQMKNSELNEKTQNLFANRSDYDYRIDGNVLAIEDLGGYKSVTNDIENVIKDIMDKEKIDISKFMVMYKDSMGIWDGIKVDNTTRIEFFSINERIYSQAKGKLKHIS